MGTVHFTLPLLLLILARASDGITAGNISIANAYLSDVSTPEDRSRNFGRMSAASSLGFILGPAVAGVVGTDVNAAYLAIAVSLVGLFCIWFFLKESLVKPLSESPCGSQTKRQMGAEIRDCNEKTTKSFDKLIARKPLLHLFVLYFVIYLGFNIFYSTFPLMAKTVLSWSPSQLGTFFSTMGACLVVVQTFVLPRLSKYLSETQLLMFGAALLATAKALLMFESQFIWFVPVFFALGNGLLWPSYLTILSSQGDSSEQGSIQGYGSSFGSMASIIGLLAGSLLFSQFGSAVFVASSLIFVFVGFQGLVLKVKPVTVAS